jgi:hypothetical protein
MLLTSGEMCAIIGIMNQKLCINCNKMKDLEDFGIRRAEKDGLHYYCKKCHKEKSAQYRKDNPDSTRQCVSNYRKQNPEKVKDSQLRTKYGISLDKRNEMIDNQGGKCLLCDVEFSEKWDERPGVDHDHTCCPGSSTCGKCIRGILCLRCNAWLGRFEDKPEMFIKALDYLRNNDHRRKGIEAVCSQSADECVAD